jgi:hypothetical protein
MTNESIKETTTRLAESSSFSGKIIASSYFRVTIFEIIDTTDMYKARTPKSAGEYIRVITGDKANGIAWAIVVPVIRVNTLIANPFLGIFLCIC